MMRLPAGASLTLLLMVVAFAHRPLPASASTRDPERLAYLAWTEGYWQVWAMTLPGEEGHQLTHSAIDKTALSWFPDGRRLLVNTIAGRPLQVGFPDGVETPLALPREGVFDATIGPDGRQIAFSVRSDGGGDDNDIWIVALGDSRPARRIVSMPRLQHQPRWSPSGRWIYFLSGDGTTRHDVWRTELPTGARQQLTTDGRFHFEIAVGPNERLAYSSNRTGNYEIYTQDEPPGKPVRWTDHPALDGHPTWVDGGRALVFHSDRGGELNLWWLDTPLADPRQLTKHEGGARGPVAWSPPRRAT
jgi:TolB protein